MSKNQKLSIKNTQIAEAVNLKGLKAKLAKKKPTDGTEGDLEDTKPRRKIAQDAPVLEQMNDRPSAHQPVEKKPIQQTNETVTKSAAPAIETEKKQNPEPSLSSSPETRPLPRKAPIAEEPKMSPRRTAAPEETSRGYRSERPAAEGYRNDRSATGGYRSDRPASEGYRNDRPATGGYRGDRPATGGYRSDRPATGGYRGDRPATEGYRRPPFSSNTGAQRPYSPRPTTPRGPSYDRKSPPQRPYERTTGPRPMRDGPRPQGPHRFPSSAAGDRRYPPLARSNEHAKPFTSPGSNVGAMPKNKEGGSRLPPAERTNKFESRKGMEIEFRPGKKTKEKRGQQYDTRVRHGLVSSEEGETWRKKRHAKFFIEEQIDTIRPSKIKVRLPIALKDLASEMKLKASELVQKLFLQGVIITLNDILDDEVLVQLLGHEFGCEIVVDTTEQERIQITDKSVSEEIAQDEADSLVLRAPVVAFMGHVDHGKTSLIDAIRKSNLAAKEIGAITQHIGAFRTQTSHGPITILDTPGHEAFQLMRERGAEITDVVVLVIAGDEGMQEQTLEALKMARNASRSILVAITKSDKHNFDAEMVMRQLAEQELLPEAWGGQTVTVSCSAQTGAGIEELLEMVALQAEILELRANPKKRARGVVIESEVIQGLGGCATVLVRNGTLREGDALVFATSYARVKSMRDEFSKAAKEAMPSTPVLISGLSGGLPQAGEEFIVVKDEKEAKLIAEKRQEGKRLSSFMIKKRQNVEALLQNQQQAKKTLNLIVRADVQGSLEALKKALEKIHTNKVVLEFISLGVGQISESDVQLAAASKAVIVGFHTSLESHAEPMVKEMHVDVRQHDIIYHAVDDIKTVMRGLLDKVPEEQERGSAHVRMCFKSSQLGVIAGCIVTEGVISRNHLVRVRRNGEVVWKGQISSVKRVKEDVKEVQKGVECGILLKGFNDVKAEDVLEAYEVVYLEQDL